MKKAAEAALCVLAMLWQSMTFGADVPGQEVRFEGTANVTAAAAFSNDMFIVASAKDNVLRIYKVTAPFTPVSSFDLSSHLDVDPAIPVTIAGAAKVRDRIYWITSHSRDEGGKVRPERYCFFATTITEKNGRFTIEPVGKPCKTLIHKLVNLNTVSTLGLDKATRFGERERIRLAPADQGLNIGALCASHNSNMLYIALRNPRPVRVMTGTPHALIVPLDNAADVIEKGEDPIFGEGMLWDLKGLGIVGFEYSPAHGDYFVVAGSHDGQGAFALYHWSGMKACPPERITLPQDHSGLFASAIVPFENRSSLLLLGEQTKDAIVSGHMNGGPHTASFLAFWCRP
jgi:hypothetical protein